jgi:hypothetical protein
MLLPSVRRDVVGAPRLAPAGALRLREARLFALENSKRGNETGHINGS